MARRRLIDISGEDAAAARKAPAVRRRGVGKRAGSSKRSEDAFYGRAIRELRMELRLIDKVIGALVPLARSRDTV